MAANFDIDLAAPLEEAIFYDHPSGRARIRMAMAWKAERLGEPGVR